MDSGAPITIAPVLSPESQLFLGQFFIITTGYGDLSGIVAKNSLSRPSNTATQKAAMGGIDSGAENAWKWLSSR